MRFRFRNSGKTEVTATPNPTKAPQKSGTSEKTPANENKSQGTSGEKDNSSAGSSGTSENTQEDTSRTVEEKVESGEITQDGIQLFFMILT